MLKFIRALAVLLIINFLSPAPVAYASYAGTPWLTTDQLIAESQVIAVGKIIGHESYLEQGSPVTDTILKVDYYLGKGVNERVIRIKEDGGTVRLPDNSLIGSSIRGKIGEVGDRVCFFLKKRADKYSYVKPNGVLVFTSGDLVLKNHLYEETFTSLPRIYPVRPTGLYLFIGVLNLFVVLLLLSCPALRKHSKG